MTKANRKLVHRKTRRRGTNRRGGAGAGASASASHRSHGSSHCEWMVISSMVDREDMDIQAFDDNNEPLHPSVHFNDIATNDGRIRNRHLRHVLRQTCNEERTNMIAQRGIPRVTHVQRSRQMLSFFHDGECVGHVIVAPTGRVPAWMVRDSPNPKRSPGGTKFPKWMTTSHSVVPAEPEDNNDIPMVDIGEIADNKHGEITQTSLRHMLSHTCNRVNAEHVPVQGITNVTHVSRHNRLLSFYNNDTYLGYIIVQAMGKKQPSWMMMPR